MGAPLKQQLNNLKPVQLTELETEFNNLKQEKVVVSRHLRSQKPKSLAVGDSALSDADEGKFHNSVNLLQLKERIEGI